MTPALTAAAERLISLPGFRWMPGMRDTEGFRVLSVHMCGVYTTGIESIKDGKVIYHEADAMGLPDLSDPATLGCITAIINSMPKVDE